MKAQSIYEILLVFIPSHLFYFIFCFWMFFNVASQICLHWLQCYIWLMVILYYHDLLFNKSLKKTSCLSQWTKKMFWFKSCYIWKSADNNLYSCVDLIHTCGHFLTFFRLGKGQWCPILNPACKAPIGLAISPTQENSHGLSAAG